MFKINKKNFLIRLAMFLFALLGLGASIYLFYGYSKPAPLFCGPLNGCEAVRSSSWSHVFGVPTPVLGILFYLSTISLLGLRFFKIRHQKLALLIQRGLAFIGLLESVFLFFIQWLQIQAFCTWCLVSAISATMIFIISCFDSIKENINNN